VSDLGLPKAKIILARLDLQIDEQRLVLEQKDIRLSEIDDEQTNVDADIARVEALQADVLSGAPKGSSLDAKRAALKAHEYALAVKGKRIRLLELDEEREQIATDKTASLAHITKLEAEVQQQQARLKDKG
jgi:hypothetical protein